MTSNCLSSFSFNQESFCVFSAGGIASIWGCRDEGTGKLISSTVLPHHLQAVCTCFAWTPINTSTKGHSTNELLAYGSSSGSVFIFNALSSSVVALPENGHTGSVSAVAWHPNGTILYSAADDGFLIEWDVKSNRLLRRWRCPSGDGRNRGGYTALAVSSGAEQKLVAARQQIDVWDLSAGRVTHTFVGHSSDVFSLLPIVCSEKDETSYYVLSLARNDRVMYSWRLDGPPQKSTAERSSSYAAFLLPDSAISAKTSFHPDSHIVNIFAVLSNGCVAAFQNTLNGKKVQEPVRHAALIEMVATGINKRLSIVDGSPLCNGEMMTLAYGDLSRPQFESFDMKTHWNEKHVKIFREIPKVGEGVMSNGKPGAVGKFHVATAIPSSSLKMGNKRTLGETLKQHTAFQEASASSVLAQGLLSRDNRILDSVLGGPGADPVARRNSENQKHIETALDSLDNGLLLTLLDELTARLATGHPAASQIAIRWIAVLLRFRGSRLASPNNTGKETVNSVVAAKLAYLRDTLIARTLDSSRVLQLRGRLRMLREMGSPPSAPDSTSTTISKTSTVKTLQESKSSTLQIQKSNQTAVNSENVSKRRLPFVLPAADLSSSDEDDESAEDSDSAMEDVKVKRRKQHKTREEESDASSEVELASNDDDLPDGERDDRLSDDDDDEGEEDEDGPTLNGFNHDDDSDGGEMDYEMDADEIEDDNKKAAGKKSGVKLLKDKKKPTKFVEASFAKKIKTLRA